MSKALVNKEFLNTPDSSEIGYLSSGTGAVARTSQDKMRDSISVKDFGAVGSGTDESTLILAAITASIANGCELTFDGTKTYVMNLVSWTISAGARLKTNGCTFQNPTTNTSNTVWLTVSDRVQIDELNVSLPTGVRRDRTIEIDGDDVQIGSITLTSVDVQPTAEASDFGVAVTSCSRVRIGLIRVSNVDRAVIVSLTTDTRINGIVISGYVRGLYLHGNTALYIGKSRIHTRSVNASQTAGHNAVLLGRETTDQTDVTLEDFTCDNAGEHGIRIGGGPQKRIFLVRPRVFGAQGCGIKILGTDNTAPVAGEYQENIVIDSPLIEDVGSGGGSASNLCGILVERTIGCNILNPTIRPRSATWAAQFGIRIFAVEDVQIQNPMIEAVQSEGIRVDTADSGAVSAQSTRIQINGGLVYSCGDDGLSLSASDSQIIRHLTVSGLRLQSNTNRGVVAATGTGGSFLDCLINASTTLNTGGAAVCTSADVTLQMKSSAAEIVTTPLSGITAANGSWYDNATTLNIRKAGAWTAL